MRRVISTVALLLGGLAIVAVSLLALPQRAARTRGAGAQGLALVPSLHAQLPGFGPDTIADVAERVTPSVVNIFTSRDVPSGGAHRRFFKDPMFRFFFGPPGFKGEPSPRGGGRRERSLGSGVIISEDGYLLTNNHVVKGADEIRVALADGREFEAKVVGTDPPSDLAVLKVEANGLKPILVGDSTTIRVGEIVLAIGNPFGVGQTVTMGIVSAVGRSNTGIVEYEDFIQTDAAINPGNSGGALINLRGELVGINTAIASRTGGYQGIGFAIPSKMAITIKESLLKHGRVIRGWLGVAIQNVTPDLAEALGLKPGKGVLVGDVTPNSPAAKAGLQREDLIVAVDGRATNDMGRLRTVIATRGAGASVKVTLMRSGKRLDKVVKLAELPASLGGRGGSRLGGSVSALDGLAVSDLSPELQRKYEIPARLGGVVVTDVEADSRAAYSGLRAGDLVLEVNRRRVASVAELREALSRPARLVALLIYREGATLFLTLRK